MKYATSGAFRAALEQRLLTMAQQAGAPIDGFGVGTSLGVGAGSAAQGIEGGSLGPVYKLVSYEGDGEPGRIKLAGDKSTWPGKKQVYRIGSFIEDRIVLEDDEPPPRSRTLLRTAVRDGERTGKPQPLDEIRQRALADLKALPDQYRSLHEPASYPVRYNRGLEQLRQRLIEQFGSPELD